MILTQVSVLVNEAARDINFYMQKAPLFDFTILNSSPGYSISFLIIILFLFFKITVHVCMYVCMYVCIYDVSIGRAVALQRKSY